MEKKTNTEIAENLSSGAEKVERIEKEVAVKNSQKSGEPVRKSVKSVKKTGAGMQRTTQQAQKKAVEAVEETLNKANAETEKAAKRVEIALAKKRAKAEKAKKKQKAKEAKRAAAAKRREETAQAAKEKREAFLKRKAELKAKLDAEIADLEKERAEKRAKREERRKARLEKRRAAKADKAAKAKQFRKGNKDKQKTSAKTTQPEKRQKQNDRKGERRAKGYGGWLAAVISLGAVTLALTTLVTVGAMDMSAMNRGAMAANRGTLYEFIGVMENVDEDLDRARISNTPAQQSRILTDLLVQARVAEIDLEKLPMKAEDDANLTSFINRTAQTAERLLAKLRRGDKLTEQDQAKLQELYETNHTVRCQLEEMSAKLTEKDMKNFLKGAKNKLTETLDGIERATLPENAIGSAKTLEEPFGDFALEKRDGTDGENGKENENGKDDKRTTPDQDKEGEKLSSSAAEERVKAYFSEYAIEKIDYAGETISRGVAAYNFCLKDKDGVSIFAQVSETDGSLIRFDYYKDCKDRNFSADSAKIVAEEFLLKLGYGDMIATRLSEFGTDADFLFVKESNGFLIYPQSVKVKVCEERGMVTGFDASEYLQNKATMVEPNAKISLSDAQTKLHKDLSIVGSQACVVKAADKMRTAYEFICNYEDETYLIYVDAVTGDEISIVNVRELA